MSGPGAVAEEAPVLVGLYMTIEAVLTWLLARAVLLLWIFTIGAILVALGNLLTYDKYFIHIHWGGAFFKLNNDIHQWLVDQVVAQEFAIGWWWHQTSRLQAWIVHETWAGMRDLYHWGGWVVNTYVPTYVHGWGDVLHTRTQTITKQVTVVTHKTTAITRDVLIPHAGELNWIHKHWKALTRVVAAGGAIALFPPLAIPKIWHGIDEIKERLERQNKRLHKIEGLVGAAAFAALMANSLGLGHNWRCITRGNVGRMARFLCGTPTWLLDLLILGTLEAFIARDLCGFTDLLIKEAEQIRPALMELVDVEDVLIDCHGTVKPLAFDLPPLSLPPMPGPSALAA